MKADRDRTMWLEGDDRWCVLRPYAMRLWEARDTAKVRGTCVEFDGCRYERRASEPNEFESGTSRLDADGNVFITCIGEDVLTQAFDAVVAWRLIRLMTGRAPVPPASIPMPAGPPRTVRRPGLAGRLFGLTATVRDPAYEIVDPMQVARHECGRLLHELVVEERAHPVWGRITMKVGRGIEIWTQHFWTATHPDGGSTRIHPAWIAPISRAVKDAERADPRWRAQQERHEREPSYCHDFI